MRKFFGPIDSKTLAIKFFFSFLILLLAIFYLLFLMLDLIDVFWALLSRMGCSVATRAMYISFLRMTGCSGSMALVLFFALSLSKEGICYMEDAGPSTGGRAVDSGSGSDSWQKYLDLSEGNSESSTGNKEPTFDQPVRAQPQAASPSTSTSWIEKWFYPEGSSEAPNQGQQPQWALEASTGTSSRAHQQAGPSQSEAGGPLRVSPSKPSLPTSSWFEGAEDFFKSFFGDQGLEVSNAQNPITAGTQLSHPAEATGIGSELEEGPDIFHPLPPQQNPHAEGQPIGPHAPTIAFLIKKIPSVISSCQCRQVKTSFLTTIFEDLHLETASPQKRLQIMEVLTSIEQNREIFLSNSQRNAAYYLMVSINDWEREKPGCRPNDRLGGTAAGRADLESLDPVNRLAPGTLGAGWNPESSEKSRKVGHQVLDSKVRSVRDEKEESAFRPAGVKNSFHGSQTVSQISFLGGYAREKKTKNERTQMLKDVGNRGNIEWKPIWKGEGHFWQGAELFHGCKRLHRLCSRINNGFGLIHVLVCKRRLTGKVEAVREDWKGRELVIQDGGAFRPSTAAEYPRWQQGRGRDRKEPEMFDKGPRQQENQLRQASGYEHLQMPQDDLETWAMRAQFWRERYDRLRVTCRELSLRRFLSSRTSRIGCLGQKPTSVGETVDRELSYRPYSSKFLRAWFYFKSASKPSVLFWNGILRPSSTHAITPERRAVCHREIGHPSHRAPQLSKESLLTERGPTVDWPNNSCWKRVVTVVVL
ncbi:hypothetical protein ACFE04_019617 [Oxalis oulophora]